MRLLTQDAASVSPDAQGRIIIPQALLDHAGISKDAVVVGCDDYVEIWAAELRVTCIEEEDPEAVRATLESFGL
jgi:MraZ protein